MLVLSFDYMSIARGVNRITPKNSPTKHPAKHLQIEQPNQSGAQLREQKLIKEMKTLMKQNTKLRHQNLKLKQQIMIVRIELENLKLQQQSQSQCDHSELDDEHHFSRKMTEKFSLVATTLPNLEGYVGSSLHKQGQIEAFSVSLKNKGGKSRIFQSLELNCISQRIQKDKSQKPTKQFQGYFSKNQNKQELPSTRATKPVKSSKKQQILSKYRPYLSQNSSNLHTINSIRLQL